MSRRLGAGAVAGLLAAAAAAGFALGRLAPRPEAGPAPGELAAELRRVLAGGDAFDRFGRAAALLRNLDPGSLPEVLAVYDQMLPLIGPDELRPVAAAWARIDPGGALEHSLDWGTKAKREASAAAALEAWAQNDPSTARQAYEDAAAQHPPLARPLLAGLVAGWVHSQEGPAGLDAFFAELDPTSREEAAGIAIRELVRKGGAEAALAWADPILRNGNLGLPYQSAVFWRTVRAAARFDPERTAAWAAQFADRPYGGDAPPIIATQWANRDGRAALSWLRGLPPGAPRDEGVRRAFARWWQQDPAAAEAWLDSEASAELRDPALSALAAEQVAEEPLEALAVCERVQDPEHARRCRVDAASRWYRQDAEAAEAWLAQSSLDEEARRQVKAPRAPRRGSGARRPLQR